MQHIFLILKMCILKNTTIANNENYGISIQGFNSSVNLINSIVWNNSIIFSEELGTRSLRKYKIVLLKEERLLYKSV